MNIHRSHVAGNDIDFCYLICIQVAVAMFGALTSGIKLRPKKEMKQKKSRFPGNVLALQIVFRVCRLIAHAPERRTPNVRLFCKIGKIHIALERILSLLEVILQKYRV